MDSGRWRLKISGLIRVLELRSAPILRRSAFIVSILEMLEEISPDVAFRILLANNQSKRSRIMQSAKMWWAMRFGSKFRISEVLKKQIMGIPRSNQELEELQTALWEALDDQMRERSSCCKVLDVFGRRGIQRDLVLLILSFLFVEELENIALVSKSFFGGALTSIRQSDVLGFQVQPHVDLVRQCIWHKKSHNIQHLRLPGKFAAIDLFSLLEETPNLRSLSLDSVRFSSFLSEVDIIYRCRQLRRRLIGLEKLTSLSLGDFRLIHLKFELFKDEQFLGRQLRSLTVHDSRILSSAIQFFSPNLLTLSLENCSISPYGFAQLIQRFFNLEDLRLIQVEQLDFSQVDLSYWRSLPLLNLRIEYCAELSSLPELPPPIRKFALYQCESRAVELPWGTLSCSTLTFLKECVLRNVPGSNVVRILARAPNLKYLAAEFGSCESSALEALNSEFTLSALDSLNISSGVPLSIAAISRILNACRCGLRHLKLSSDFVDDDFLMSLFMNAELSSLLSRLNSLSLGRSEISLLSISHLSRHCQNLRYLDLGGCVEFRPLGTLESLSPISKYFPRLRELKLNPDIWTPSDIRQLSTSSSPALILCASPSWTPPVSLW